MFYIPWYAKIAADDTIIMSIGKMIIRHTCNFQVIKLWWNACTGCRSKIFLSLRHLWHTQHTGDPLIGKLGIVFSYLHTKYATKPGMPEMVWTCAVGTEVLYLQNFILQWIVGGKLTWVCNNDILRYFVFVNQLSCFYGNSAGFRPSWCGPLYAYGLYKCVQHMLKFNKYQNACSELKCRLAVVPFYTKCGYNKWRLTEIIYQHIEAEAKWSAFSRRHVPIHFIKWIWLNLD